MKPQALMQALDASLLRAVATAVEHGEWEKAAAHFQELRDKAAERQKDPFLKIVGRALELEDATTAKDILASLKRMDENVPRELVEYGVKAKSDQVERWSKQIGSLLMAFGGIEGLTYLGLKALPRDSIFKNVVRLNFGQRADILSSILNGRRHDAPTLVAVAIELMNSAKKLAETRNLVAHNPLSMNIYQESDGRIRLAEEISHHTNDERRLSYEELVASALEAQLLVGELTVVMHQLIGRLSGESALLDSV